MAIETNNTEELLAAGSAIAGAFSPLGDPDAPLDPATGTPYLVVPDGYKVHDLEHLLPSPVRKRAKVSVSDSAGFIHYTEKHGGEHNCVIYADIDHALFSAGIHIRQLEIGSDIGSDHYPVIVDFQVVGS